MTTILLVIQVLLALGIIGLVLIQRSESDGFGMGSGSGLGVISGRAKANLLTRATAILAGLFMFNSLLLAIVTANATSTSLVDRLENPPIAVEKKDTTAVPVEGTDQSLPVEEETAPSQQPPAVEGDAPAQDTPPVTDAPAPAPVVPRAE